MRRLFSTEVIQELLGGSADPKEEAIGDCIEICLGVLRVALMYEGCDHNYFGWSDINEVLTGLEHSLLVFTASAHQSGAKNRKMNSSNKKRRVFNLDDCLDVPIAVIPMTRCPVTPPITAQSTIPPLEEAVMPQRTEIVDVDMPDAAQSTEQAEGTGLGAAYPSTGASEGGAVAAPGSDESKRRKVTPQTQMHDLFDSTLDAIGRIISSENVCVNCLSNDHKIEDCPNEGAPEWKKTLMMVQDCIEARRTAIDAKMEAEDTAMAPEVKQEEEEQHQEEEQRPTEEVNASKRMNISLHHESRSLEEIVGAGVMTNVVVGGKNPREIGFKKLENMFAELHDHIQKTEYIPQIGHVAATDQNGMRKYKNWTTEMKYGEAVPIGSKMAPFADPKWDVCGEFSHCDVRRWRFT